ncbi:MAG: type III polyketide synthase [Proteobacteria bacterium]|nr:type III polyketide synthase [Pseudomonadota bacterium]MDA1355032.1 type III polyketide synthase [Pseudomonadota bacterium]
MASTATAANARLGGLATAVPDHVLNQEDVMRGAAKLFQGSFHDFERLIPVFKNAAIGTRHSCVPIEWYLEEHSFAERNALFIENAVNLLEQAVLRCLERAGLAIEDVDALVVASTSGIAAPSLDALLLERLEMRRNVQRLPIFGLGCAGGVIGLARAGALARAMPGANVVFAVVELCGLTFRFNDRSKSNVIATALFGDGAAAAVVNTEMQGPEISAWGEHTWPDTLEIMGWRIEDDGFGVLFSRDIPNLVRSKMRAAAEEFLADHDLALKDIDEFVCHPGGAKVLTALEEAFGLQSGGLEHGRETLRQYGNMSAATIMFVLERALAHGDAKGAGKNGGRRMMSSLGPGFTAGFLVLEGA